MENEEKKFSWQTCQDEELNKKFYELHKTLVNQIAEFCKDNNLKIDEVSLSVDGLQNSIPYSEWTAATDSSMTMYNVDWTCEPFLCSM